MSFISHLSSLIPVSKELEKEINSISKRVQFNKNDILVKTDSKCNDLFFVEKGLLRGFYLAEGKEITNWFAQEQEFATCFYSFIANKPSFETIQALEDCELLKINNTSLMDLYRKFPETERIGRIITENYYIKLEERILGLQFKTAKERYANLFTTKPTLIQRASLGQIASYLGITQETLSRIRS